MSLSSNAVIFLMLHRIRFAVTKLLRVSLKWNEVSKLYSQSQTSQKMQISTKNASDTFILSMM